VPGQQIEERRLRIDRPQSVQQQDRWTFALAQHLEINAAYHKPLDPGWRLRH
jgi:hypothetical protein